MGTYLSTPILDKHTETDAEQDDANTPVRWAVVDMQGWRKSMEDAHVARTDVPLPKMPGIGGGGGGSSSSDNNNDHDGEGENTTNTPTHAKVFAVFDGHGGAEVARFCSVHLVPTLTSNTNWTGCSSDVTSIRSSIEENSDIGSSIGHALVDSFHALDRLIDDPTWRPEIEKYRMNRPPPYVSSWVDGQDENSSGGVLQPPQSPDALLLSSSSSSSSEIMDLDVDAAAFAEDAAKLLAILKGSAGDSVGDVADVVNPVTVIEDECLGDDEIGGIKGEMNTGGSMESADSLIVDDDDEDDEVFEDSLSEQVDESTLDDELVNKDSDGVVRDDSDDDDEEEEDMKEKSADHHNDNVDGEVNLSTVVANGGLPGESKGTRVLSANDAVALFQKLLRMNGTDEGDVVDDDDDDDEDDAAINKHNNEEVGVNRGDGGGGELVIPTRAQLLNPPTGIVAPSVSVPTRIQNGRKMCNLPDHPVHAGCTSIVAVIVGRTLVVANAGDSRAVLCRAGGVTEPLSFDHKPLQNRELNRITNAGGFVNQFGRVNGNLNLSRSIGDLKYKQVPGIPPAEQMITAEPDIISTMLRTGDEFIVLGCDGIWDCLSNEECVKYVRDRIDSKHPCEIGKEMLDEIVSSDPRASQGIGGDNMTIVIIDLLPHSRPYGNQR